MKQQSKKFYLASCSHVKKIVKSAIATDATLHHMRKTRLLYLFLIFLSFVEWDKNLEKKILMGKYGKKFYSWNFASLKKNCFQLKHDLYKDCTQKVENFLVRKSWSESFVLRFSHERTERNRIFSYRDNVRYF
jgi:hypothetical protein